MSLSRRLVLILVAIVAAGLAVVAVASYVALRSYLSDRLDQQVEQALPLVARAVIADLPAGDVPRFPSPPPGAEEGGVTPEVRLSGIYGELRDASGEVLASRSIGGEQGFGRPDLPSRLDLPDTPGSGSTFDVPAEGSGAGFRVVAQRGPEGTMLVAAISTQDYEETLSRVRRIELIVSLAVLAVLALVSLAAVRAGLRPLARMERTARGIAAGDMSHRVEDIDERTEVGRLGIAFNEMLARLERAFAEQRASEGRLRRFLSDASHELRTPLASIRGYAELFRRGADANPADLERSMARIESESVRMGRLVDDLLTLARLDELREGRREPVDLVAITADARDDAEAAHPSREIRLEHGDAARVLGDPDRLRQLVVNLLANALEHAPDGPVEIAVERRDSEVRLTIRDHGPGLPKGAEAEVFERFWRAGDARDRESGGAGLGLAIVAGVAAAHGGSAQAGNAAGGGAIFTITLPAAGVADRGVGAVSAG